MNNFRIDIIAQGPERLCLAFELISRWAVAYRVDPKFGLIFYWSTDGMHPEACKLPFEMTAEQTADFAGAWLMQGAVYPAKPSDFDISCEAGWRVYNGVGGSIDGHWGSFAAVQPVWALYGK